MNYKKRINQTVFLFPLKKHAIPTNTVNTIFSFFFNFPFFCKLKLHQRLFSQTTNSKEGLRAYDWMVLLFTGVWIVTGRGGYKQQFTVFILRNVTSFLNTEKLAKTGFAQP